ATLTASVPPHFGQVPVQASDSAPQRLQMETDTLRHTNLPSRPSPDYDSSSMRVAFVHPAGYNFCPGQPDLTLLANRMAPIGILCLSAWLEEHRHETMNGQCLGTEN